MTMTETAADTAAEVQQLRAQLAQLRAAQEEFLRAVSHDLRAPLRHITSYGPLVAVLLHDAGLQGQALQEAQEFLTTMDQSARRMGRMLDGLLALSQIARAPLQRQPVAPTSRSRVSAHSTSTPATCFMR